MDAEDEAAKRPAASPEARATMVDPTALLAQPHDDASKPGGAPSEAVAAERDAGGYGTSGDDGDSRHHDVHPSIDDSSVNPLSSAFYVGSTQMPDGPTLECVQSNVLGDSSPSVIGPANLLGTVGSLSNDVVEGIVPLGAAMQPALATGTGSTGTSAPIEAAALATASETASSLTNDVAAILAPAEAAA